MPQHVIDPARGDILSQPIKHQRVSFAECRVSNHHLSFVTSQPPQLPVRRSSMYGH